MYFEDFFPSGQFLCEHEIMINVSLNILPVVPIPSHILPVVPCICFGLLSVIAFSNIKLNYVHYILGGRLVGVKTIRKPSSSGPPKAGHGRLIEVTG